MYLMYVDESGDSGLNNSPVNYFVLSGLVIHELRWKILLDELIEFRRFLKTSKGLKLREELHASDMINKPGELVRIKRNDRVDILKKCISWIAAHEDLNIINVVVDKRNKSEDVFMVLLSFKTERDCYQSRGNPTTKTSFVSDSFQV